ncbi:hypothetical protein V2G26_015540 [Clonostachys chloroleuca]
MERSYAPLRPRGSPGEDAPTAGSANPSVDGAYGESLEQKRRRIGVSIACNECRRKKIRCDGRRPVCTHCSTKNFSHCEYRNDALSSECRTLLLEVVKLLNSIPSMEMVRLLDDLGKADAVTIITTLRDRVKAIPGGAGEQDTAATGPGREGSPDSAELKLDHPLAYPNVAKMDPELFDTGPYQGLIQALPHSPVAVPQQHLSAQPTSAAEPTPSSTSDSTPGPQGSSFTVSPETSRSRTHEPQPPPLGFCDPRLKDLRIARWTTVDIDDSLAAKCISLYLETDHPLLGHFDPDLFLDDLISEQEEEQRFCSPLLVNALLYWACQMYSAIEPKTDTMAIEFCTVAEKLWNSERSNGRDSILFMAASEFLSLGYLGQGRDHSVLKYLNEACQTGIRLRLLSIGSLEPAVPMQMEVDKESQELRQRMYAAWGVFNFAALMSLFYRQPGMHISLSCPHVPIPTASNVARLQGRSSPLHYMGYTFPHLCRFWNIVHEVSAVYNKGNQHPWASGSNLAFAEFKFRELLAWSQNLSFRQAAEHADSPHHVKVMHLWFHAAILDIFRPFTSVATSRHTPLRTFANSIVTPQLISESSTARLKSLILNYRTHHASSSYTILWHTALLYAANSILDMRGEEAKQDPYILLVLNSYIRLSATWRVAKAIFKGLLSMILRRGDMSSDVARKMLSDLDNIDKGDEDPITGGIRATFMMDLQQAPSEPESATVESLAEDFETNVMLNEYTNILEKR